MMDWFVYACREACCILTTATDQEMGKGGIAFSCPVHHDRMVRILRIRGGVGGV